MRERRVERWAVMISGRGSNLAALLELREELDIRLVLSSRADAPGLLRARRAGVPTGTTPFRAGGRKIDWSAVTQLIAESGATHVFLAGFMKLLPTEFIESFKLGRIVNIHPSLLPSYPGLRSIERAHADGSALGCTVHEVIEEVDAGKVLCQRRSLAADEVGEHGLARAEFLLHIDEQRIVKEVMRRGSWS